MIHILKFISLSRTTKHEHTKPFSTEH